MKLKEITRKAKRIKVKEWCIALDNVSSYIDSVLGLRYKFLKGERATKEKVFSMIPSMTEEDYARYFRPATEEEINGEFEWDGEQYVLEKPKRMKSIKEKAKEWCNNHSNKGCTEQCDGCWQVKSAFGCEQYNMESAYEEGANYVLNVIQTYVITEHFNLEHIIKQLKK